VKIDVRHIVSDHFKTLVNAQTGKTSLVDVFTFYVVPGLVTSLIVHDFKAFPESFYGLAISVFSIFAALLFSVQIALFNIFHGRAPTGQRDSVNESPAQKEKTKDRNDLIKEVNSNISYLILLSCLGVATLLFFSLTVRLELVRSIFSSYFVAHFLLTIVLIVARVHTLFDEEYK
jgi:hypothetical protein